MPSAYAIVDLQFGSTGKGLLAGYLAKRLRPDAIVTNWSPNAGHTYIDENGVEYVHTMLANGVVSDSVEKVFIGPGSNVNIEALMKEVVEFDMKSGKREPFDIIIHENAGVVLQEHRDQEETDKAMIGIGSTKKGVGAAVVNKIKRDPNGIATMGQWKDDFGTPDEFDATYDWLWHSIVSHEKYLEELSCCELIQMEGCQGYSLGINSGMYPYTTSRECTVTQLMSDTLIPPRWMIDIYGVARTYPIRVANRYNEQGDMVGTSGPGYPDQQEIPWSDVGVKPELTTVTKLPRRIFTFSPMQLNQAIVQNSVTKLFMNFMNYLEEGTPETNIFVQNVMSICHKNNVRWQYMGWGPNDSDITTDEEMENIIRIMNGVEDNAANS